jgi:hypothetical protein
MIINSQCKKPQKVGPFSAQINTRTSQCASHARHWATRRSSMHFLLSSAVQLPAENDKYISMSLFRRAKIKDKSLFLMIYPSRIVS